MDTPLWKMNNEELGKIATMPSPHPDKTLFESDQRRKLAATILVNRDQQKHNPSAFAKLTSYTL